MNEQDIEKKDNSPASGDMDDFNVFVDKYVNSNNDIVKEPREEQKKVSKDEDDSEEYYDSTYSTPKKMSKLKKFTISIIAVLVVFSTAFMAYALTLPADRVREGVTVSGIPIGGMTHTEAYEKLKSSNISGANSIVLDSGTSKYTLTPHEIDAQLNFDETVDRAFNYGKNGNIITNAFTSLKVMVVGKDIAPVITYDENKLSDIINKMGSEAIGSAVVNHSVRFDDDGTAYIVPGKSGYNNDPTEIIKQIDNALNKEFTTNIKIIFKAASPGELTIEALDALMYKDPVNATFVRENGEIVIKPEEKGRYIDKEACAELLPQIKENGPEVKIPYSAIDAEITKKSLEGKLFNKELASYTTRFNAGSVNRSSNIANAASKVNGTILLPGETFSFNKVVGKRTVSNGFKQAPEYQNGQSVMGIGGGTCQASTTVYSAALYAGLKITKRSNHSMSVNYVPLGQDATVTDGGLDLQFLNNTDYPIKIKASVSGGSVTVTIVGTATTPEKTVKLVHTRVAANSGSAVRTTRIFYDVNGNELSREDLGVSRYKPHGSGNSSDNNSSNNNSTSSNNESENNNEPEATESNSPAPTKKPESSDNNTSDSGENNTSSGNNSSSESSSSSESNSSSDNSSSSESSSSSGGSSSSESSSSSGGGSSSESSSSSGGGSSSESNSSSSGGSSAPAADAPSVPVKTDET